jgi:hypothetical protein
MFDCFEKDLSRLIFIGNILPDVKKKQVRYMVFLRRPPRHIVIKRKIYAGGRQETRKQTTGGKNPKTA